MVAKKTIQSARTEKDQLKVYQEIVKQHNETIALLNQTAEKYETMLIFPKIEFDVNDIQEEVIEQQQPIVEQVEEFYDYDSYEDEDSY